MLLTLPFTHIAIFSFELFTLPVLGKFRFSHHSLNRRVGGGHFTPYLFFSRNRNILQIRKPSFLINRSQSYKVFLKTILCFIFNWDKVLTFWKFNLWRFSRMFLEFGGSCFPASVLNLVGRVPSWFSCGVWCHRAFLRSSWVPNFFSWIFCGSRIFSRGYFVGLQFFLVGISWVPIFFTWVFRGFKIFSQFRNFLVFAAWEKEYRNIYETSYSIPQLQFHFIF